MAERGQIDEAIAYLRERAGSTTSETSIARFAEEELLKAGRRAEAFKGTDLDPAAEQFFVDYDKSAGASFEVRFRLDEKGRPLALVLRGEDGTERELQR